MSTSVFIISLMYTPEFHLCYARKFFEKNNATRPGLRLGQAEVKAKLCMRAWPEVLKSPSQA
jgi:hypothetical protein